MALRTSRTCLGICSVPSTSGRNLGGTLLGLYATMGDYDFVILGEAESCRKAAIFALRLTQRVDVQLTTMRAFGEGEIPGLWTDAFPDPVPPYPSMHVSPAAGGD